MAKSDYYDILGVGRTASTQEIKAAYRKLALKYHPDHNPNDKKAEDRFKEVSEAYDALSDPEKRKRYDQFGHAGVDMGTGDTGAHSNMHMDINDIFDMFGDIFGAGGQQKRKKQATGPEARRGHDLYKEVTIALKQAFMGTSESVTIYRYIACEGCQGRGIQKGTSFGTCSKCKGTGHLSIRQGMFTYSQTCQECGGEGFSIPNPCLTCKGQSRIQTHDSFTYNIPAGIYDGSELKIAKKGDAGMYGGQTGDLIIRITVKPDKNFKRVDNDLVVTLSLSYPQLVFGSQVEVTSLDDSRETIKIPKGCAVGDKIRIAGKGFVNVRNNSRGDFVVIAHCVIPKKLSADAKETLKAFAQQLDEQDGTSEGITGFFKKFLG